MGTTIELKDSKKTIIFFVVDSDNPGNVLFSTNYYGHAEEFCWAHDGAENLEIKKVWKAKHRQGEGE